MKGKETTKGPPSADLLVCFPSRAHLNIMPKPVCSPARSLEPSKRHRPWRRTHHHHHHHHLLKTSTRGGQASPLLWTKTKHMGSEIAEPSSPKVTCAGQIKIKPKVASSKSWQSVMEEIERIHNNRRLKKRPSWLEGLGIKKEVTQLLTCLRGIRFHVRCFGSLPQPEVTTDDEDNDDNNGYEIRYRNNHVGVIDDTSQAVFSKWFMLLQENQNSDAYRENTKRRDGHSSNLSMDAPSAPPPNALLLMRCRSAPAKSWLKETEQEEEEHHNDEKEKENERKEEKIKKLRHLIDDEKKKEEKRDEIFMALKCDTVSCRNSFENDKETWVFGGIKDPFSRSKSWKR